MSDGEQSVIVPCQALLIIEELERFRDSFRELVPLAVRSWVPTEDTLASASKCGESLMMLGDPQVWRCEKTVQNPAARLVLPFMSLWMAVRL